ncbi:MAG TPA: TIGR03557 family F420-dependent LLM class oxidoreductase [Jiangellaceae bacterium]
MARFGYVLSSEEWGPDDLVWQAVQAQDAGFESLGISDHFHPWNDEQGQSPFVWGVLGAISREVDIPISTHVTAPILRIHPAIVAQAAATASLQFRGRFVLGVGSGEALNEQILGDMWPLADERLDMLDEAVEIMRALWSGDVVTHHGEHYAVEWARLYTAPAEPIPVYVSAFGPKALELAGRIGDGLVSTSPEADAIETFNKAGGAGKPTLAGTKLCYGPDLDAAVETAHRLWPNTGLPGQLSQDLRTPAHFMQASSLVTADQIGSSTPCGPDLNVHLSAIREYVDAGFDEVLIHQIGPLQNEFFRFAADELLPALRET